MKKAPKNLISKLAEACNAIDAVAKLGVHDTEDYNYLRYSDLAKIVRREFFKRNILLTCDEKEVTKEDGRKFGDDNAQVITIKVEYTLHDGDSADKLTMAAFGSAMDFHDKALYKAKTGALKYFLRGIGIVPYDGDDPETGRKKDTPSDEPEIRGESDEPPVRLDSQVNAFQSACSRSGKTTQEITEYLRDEFDVQSVSELGKVQMTEAITWACMDRKFRPGSGVEQFYRPDEKKVV